MERLVLKFFLDLIEVTRFGFRDGKSVIFWM
jgi:hypothetical protein